MANRASASASDGLPDFFTIFIDTSLDTHFITVVSAFETVSDLKKKVLCEHALCFPHIGEIKIHGFKVKRRGKFYYLSESMLVKSVFHGVKKNWFITVDASSLEELNANGNCINPLANNLLPSVAAMDIALDEPALPKSCSNPPLLTNVDDNQLKKHIDSCDQRLVLDVASEYGSRDVDKGSKLMEGTPGEATPIDVNDESFSSMQERGDGYEKEKESKNTLKDGARPISKERAAEAAPDKKKSHKRKWNRGEFSSKEDSAEVPKYGMHGSEKETKEPESSLGNANGLVSSNEGAIGGPSTYSSPEANKGRGTIMQRLTTQSERTSELEKLVELNNVESRENSFDTLRDQSLKDNQLVAPAPKRRRTTKQVEEGDGDLLKDDGTLVSETNGVTLDHSKISQKSLVGKQRSRSPTLDGSSAGTPEAVHSQLASPSNKKRKGKNKSAKSFNHEAAAVPSMANHGVEHFEMPNNSSNLGENSAAELACDVQDVIGSEPDLRNANYLKDKQDGRSSSIEIDIKNKEASGEAIESNIKRKRVLKDHHAEDNSYEVHQASNSKGKKNKISRHRNEIHNNYQNHLSNQNGGVEEHQHNFSGQNDTADDEREFTLEVTPKTASLENYKISDQDDRQLKAKEPIVCLKLPEASENVDPPKSSKKIKKSKKRKDLVSETPSASVTEHVECFISSTSPAEPHKAAKGDHPSDTIVSSKLLEASENVDPPKSSKKIKKSKKTKDLVSETPSASVTEHVEGFISSTSPSEPHKVAKGDLPSDTLGKEPIVCLKLLEVSENVDPPKSSKKIKKSKKTKDLVSETPSTPVTEHVEAFISSTSPDEPHQVAEGNHPSDTLSKEESNRLPKVQKEMDTVSTSFLASDKEINDVIQNVVESVQQMGKDEADTESIHGKSRKKSRKKQNSDAKLVPDSIKQNKSVGYDNAGSMEHSSEATKQASVANAGCTMAENDQGIESAQVVAQKLDSNSKKGFPEAVISGSPSISGRANEVTGDVDVTCESNGVNFNEYFTPKKHNLENVVSGEMHVDGATKTNGTHGKVKSKKKTNKKHDTRSDSRASDLKTPLLGKPTVSNHGVGAKPHTGNSSPAEVEVSFAKENSEKELESNKEPSKASDKGAEPLVSSNPHKVNSAPEDAQRSTDATPTGRVNGSKRKKSASNLASSSPCKVNSVSEETQQSNDAKFTGMVNGSKSKKAESNLMSSNPHKVNSVSEEAQRSNDAKCTGMVNGSKSKKAESNPVSSSPNTLNSVPEEARRNNDAKEPTGIANGSKSKKAGLELESTKNSSILQTRVDEHQSLEDHNHRDNKKAPAIDNGEIVNSSKKAKSLVGLSGSIFRDDSDEASAEDNDSDEGSSTEDNDSEASISLPSDYSDDESNEDIRMSQYGYYSRKREEEGGKANAKPISSEMTLDKILRSSRSYKKAKQTASQLQAEDTESQLLEFVPDSQAQP